MNSTKKKTIRSSTSADHVYKSKTPISKKSPSPRQQVTACRSYSKAKTIPRPSIESWVLKDENSSPRWEESKAHKSGDNNNIDGCIYREKMRLKFQRSGKKVNGGDLKDEMELAKSFCVLFGHNVCNELNQAQSKKKNTENFEKYSEIIANEISKCVPCEQENCNGCNFENFTSEIAEKVTNWLESILSIVENRAKVHSRNAKEGDENDNPVCSTIDSILDTVMDDDSPDSWSVCTSEIFQAPPTTAAN